MWTWALVMIPLIEPPLDWLTYQIHIPVASKAVVLLRPVDAVTPPVRVATAGPLVAATSAMVAIAQRL